MNQEITSSEVPSAPARTAVYALLVGINAYVNVPLEGPVSDVNQVADFLNSLPDIDAHTEILTDEQATKPALITAFRDHLGKAQPGDTILFYFSGHGTRERADTTLWPDEPTGLLQSIACYNGNVPNSWDFLLTDKELRYLLNEVTQAGAVHTITVFDCCHSGGNTRSLLDLDAQVTRERSIPDVFPQRPWAGFLFSDQISEETVRTQPLLHWLPEPIHIQMAACEADEKALEVDHEGVFTKNLLGVLRASGGAISYESLIDRARQYMRFGYDQRPRLFVPDGSATVKRTAFLNRNVSTETPAVLAQFSYGKDGKNGWYLNVGALHGLQPGQNVSLLTREGQVLLTAPVAEVWLDYARLPIAPDAPVQPDPALVYRVAVPGLMSKPLRMFFASRNGSPAEQAAMLAGLVAAAGDCYIPEDNESAADYAIYVRNGWYFLTKPGDEFRPLAAPVLSTDKNAALKLGDYIRQLSQWTYLKILKNPAATGPGVRVEFASEGVDYKEVPTTGDDPTVAIPLIARDETYQNNVAVRVTNTTPQPLYCTVLYLSHDIGAQALFLDTNTPLAPNQTVIVGQNAYDGADNSTRTSIPLSPAGENVVHDYNWPAVDERLQLIFTTKSANASGQLSETTLDFLQFGQLPQPPTLADRASEQERAIAASRSSAVPLPTWWTQSVNLRWENPYYDKISKTDLNAMIQPRPDTIADDALADCALGLYFFVNTENARQPALQVKPELQRYWDSQHDGERGFAEDISLAVASRVSQSIRNRQFHENRTVYPNRLRIVANGDSWFQYPFLIRDIVDCLTNGYLMYSVASTDKTLKSVQQPDDALAAIREADAQLLLFSLGLNDLMDEFPDSFIRDKPDAGQTGLRRYMTDSFFQALDTMQSQYESAFKIIRHEKPDLQVIAHGYDYIRSVNAVSADRNWLAPKLSAKGIADPQDQQTLLNNMIDEFNARLKQVADRYDGLTYLDLRHAVTKPIYWHDEIHPNDAGFLDLAYKFANQIQAVQQSAKVAGS